MHFLKKVSHLFEYLHQIAQNVRRMGKFSRVFSAKTLDFQKHSELKKQILSQYLQQIR